MGKLRMAHASMHDTRKPPGPKIKRERLNDGNNAWANNGQATHGARKPPGPKIHLLICLLLSLPFHLSKAGFIGHANTEALIYN